MFVNKGYSCKIFCPGPICYAKGTLCIPKCCVVMLEHINDL